MSNRSAFVGERNPYGGGQEYALFPVPDHATGARLMRALGITRASYMTALDRYNLFSRATQSAEVTSARVDELLSRYEVVYALGRSVHDSIVKRVRATTGEEVDRAWFSSTRCGTCTVVVVPHPSGLNRLWNRADTASTLRQIVRSLSPEVYE
jgi:hypothetical protein